MGRNSWWGPITGILLWETHTHTPVKTYCIFLLFYFLKSSPEDMLIAFREREEGEERDKETD